MNKKRVRLIVSIISAALPMGMAPLLNAQVKNPDTFVYATAGDIDTLDPHWQFDWVSNTAILQIYDTLVFYKGTSASKLEPRLSTQVPSKANGLISPDGLTYTFPIRQGVKFHDGAPFTPEDVKYTLLRFMLMDRAGGASVTFLEPLLGVPTTRNEDGSLRPGIFEAADKAVEVQGHSVILHLKKPFAPLLFVLASFGSIVSKSWCAAHGGWDGTPQSWPRHNNPSKEGADLYDRANGTGPFALERWDKKDKQLVLARNERYWREPARLKRLVFKTVDEFSTRKLMLQAGDADAIFVERQFLPQVAGFDGVVVEDTVPLLEVHNPFVMNFRINTAGNPFTGSGKLDGSGIPSDFFSDIHVRKAFAHAFNYDAYLRDGYRGRGSRARGPIPKGMFGYDPKAPLVPYDLAKAAEHFRKAFGGKAWEKGFRLTICHQAGRADRQLACDILKRGIEAVNPKFKIDVHEMLWSTYLSAWTAGRVPMVNTRWAADYPDPHNFLYPFLHSQGRFHAVTGYRNPRADYLVDAGASEGDPDKRRAMYEELQRIAHDDLPVIYTLDTYFLRVRRSWVKGWDYNPMVSYFYRVYK